MNNILDIQQFSTSFNNGNVNMEFLDALPKISQSNHYVYSNGETFYKRAKNVENNSRIVVEHTVNNALKRESFLVVKDHILGLVTPSFGVPLSDDDIDETFVKNALSTMFAHFNNRELYDRLKDSVPDFSAYDDTVLEKAEYRLSLGKNPEFLVDLLKSSIPAAINGKQYGLIHSDPRPANWLKSTDGQLVAIDWESAIMAPWEYFIASFASYLYEYGRDDLAIDVLNEFFENIDEYGGYDKELLLWFAQRRTIAISSYYFFADGFDYGMEWFTNLNIFWNENLEKDF